MANGILPSDLSLEDVKIRIKKSYTNPNVRSTTQAILKDGPQAFKIATLMEIINPKTSQFHHYSLKIDHIDKKKAGWFYKPEKSIRLEGGEVDEIEKLYMFLHAAYNQALGGDEGSLHLISASEYAKLENILEIIPNIANTDKLNLVGAILSQLESGSSNISDFVNILQKSRIDTLKHIAIASRLIDYSNSANKLESLINTEGTSEAEFQKHLESNPWMFGSEYSELLSRKNWTRDNKLDYMLRKTVDDFLEIIEIKTAFNEPLFLYDKSHDSYYPSSKLSLVVGQVMRYIEEVERSRDTMLAKDGVDSLKIRARIIIGRNGDTPHQIALRNFNAHLHRIEIITYDQLLKIVERVLKMFSLDMTDNENSFEDIPF